MRRAISHLATFPEDRLFEEVGQGIEYIVQNAANLNKAAFHLHQAEQIGASNLLRGMAEEEAAKVLILIEAIRCPVAQRGPTLKSYYSHLAKRIYAAASAHPRIDTFAQLRDFVDLYRRPRFLDGPNDVDWIVGNETLSDREWGIYVDFIQDTTEPPGEYFWSTPLEPTPSGFPYDVPEALTLARALADAGATSTDGLATIASEWRHFDPSPDCDRDDVQEIIEKMLNGLIRQGAATGDHASMQFIYSHWTFPLWPLELSLDADYPSIADLRYARAEVIRRLEATAAQRDPAPSITRETVVAMDRAHAAWHQDADEYDRKTLPRRHGPGIQFRPASEDEAWDRLPSYGRLLAKLRERSSDERTALLALANFARDRVPNWPHAIRHATEMVGHLDDHYQAKLGKYWLPGLDRWEADPPPFRVGRFFHH